MRSNPNQINSHLKSCKDNTLLPVYLITGDEPLQLNEVCDNIRKTARNFEYNERQVFHVESGFDWEALLAASNTLSLFSEKRLIELRIPNGKPGDKGSKAIIKYLEHAPDDTSLLIVSGKIESQSQKSKWFKHIDNAGLVCQIWPVDAKQLPAWIEQRMRAAGLSPDREAAALLSERSEGNLLAAAQEIKKLSLLYGKTAINSEQVLASVSDNSRYTIFELTDAAMAGDAVRTIRILKGLRGEGTEPILILWALSKQIRELGIMRANIEAGAPVDSVLGKYRVWEKRKPLYRTCLQQHRSAYWQHLLIKSGHIDRVIKGAETGNSWDELLQLSLQVASIRLFNSKAISPA